MANLSVDPLVERVLERHGTHFRMIHRRWWILTKSFNGALGWHCDARARALLQRACSEELALLPANHPLNQARGRQHVLNRTMAALSARLWTDYLPVSLEPVDENALMG